MKTRKEVAMPRKFGIVVLLVTLGLGVVALAQSDYDDGSVSYPNAIREGVRTS